MIIPFHLQLMRSPRKTPSPSSPNWPTLRMKMASSHTHPSSTDCAARLKLMQISTLSKEQKHKRTLIIKMSFRKG